jgi:hypothetical protein
MGSCKANAIEVPSGNSPDESMYLSNDDSEISSSRQAQRYEEHWEIEGIICIGNLKQ